MQRLNIRCLTFVRNNIINNKNRYTFGSGLVNFSSSSNSDKVNIFNTELKKKQRSYVAKLEDAQTYDYLFDEVGKRLVDRIFDIKDLKFESVLDFGCRNGTVLKQLDSIVNDNNSDNSKSIDYHMVDSSKDMLFRDQHLDINYKIKPNRILVNNMEEPLPFQPQQFDLILSNLSIHWMNDLPGVFSHLKSLLKPNGVFLASLLGEETLTELKDSLYLGDIERHGGFTPHISPFAKLSDVGNLLSKAKFNLPTVDTEKIVIKYGSMFSLMRDLQAMGENNATYKSRVSGGRDTFVAAQSIYQMLYGNDDGSLPATFQVIYLIGWSPHHSQQKPLPRGSAKRHLSEISDNSINIKLNENGGSTTTTTTSNTQTTKNQQQQQPSSTTTTTTSTNSSLEFDATLLEPVPKSDDFIIKRLDKHGNLHEVNNPENNNSNNNNDNNNK
ncbi:hypothetical protein PPL_00452 [Heterostelium album PN500]|uniref:Methyltransferase type 11 domain-containing protein n=1 Tax=Heterostelium pallidum (strain ATCC 26659 / Pp 5 / PN500) TaxID=670386 RepID=D3AWH8_HETP5|nr:hypothetical protein PPL_00452 [Heterostelium album PN500]EFA86651.1 hypothetical protein PPL_00452 [Heterostelium album PN500]|eukprot:XP_020438756.1 hypothetical protein PPL_00452 [Heterostelium album PN500]